MKLTIDFGNPCLEAKAVLDVSPKDLNDFYASASEVDRLNLFFILLNTLCAVNETHDPVRKAHLCFLIAYYLFVPLTPPASASLALHYIHQAVSLNPLPEYLEWQKLIQKGN